MVKAVLPVALVLTLIAACDRPVASNPPSAAEQTTKREEIDPWDRSRQCADLADRLATRLRRDYPQQSSDVPHVEDWNSHYNRKEARCFVEVAFAYSLAAMRENRGLIPSGYSELWDAVETLQIAEYTSVPPKDGARLYCRVPDPGGDRSMDLVDCAAAMKFIRERMTN